MLIRNGFRTPDDFFVRLALPETPLSALLPPSHLIEHGDYEEFTRRPSGTVLSLRGFDRGVRVREAIDPETAKAPGIRHADGGDDGQEAA